MAVVVGVWGRTVGTPHASRLVVVRRFAVAEVLGRDVGVGAVRHRAQRQKVVRNVVHGPVARRSENRLVYRPPSLVSPVYGPPRRRHLRAQHPVPRVRSDLGAHGLQPLPAQLARLRAMPLLVVTHAVEVFGPAFLLFDDDGGIVSSHGPTSK